jgi:hypothetical protein
MDCGLCNKLIPEGNTNKIIIRPKGKTFATGLAYAYSTKFPDVLEDKIDEELYLKMIYEINDTI